MNAPEEPALSGEMMPAFEAVSEYVDEATSQFVTIGKIKLGHVIHTTGMDATRAVAFLIRHCVKVDGEHMTSQQILNMDIRHFNYIAEKLMAQTQRALRP